MKLSRAAILVLAGVVAAGTFLWFSHTPQQPADVARTVAPDAPALIVGSWVSGEDSSYEVAFSADGSVVESYAGQVISRGTYEFAASAPGFAELAPDEADPHAFVLEEVDGEHYSYRVNLISASRLELTYLERGNTLSFTRR